MSSYAPAYQATGDKCGTTRLSNGQANDLVEATLAHLCACLAADWKCAELHKRIGVSRRHLYRMTEIPLSLSRWKDGQLAAVADLEFELYQTENLRLALMVRASRRAPSVVQKWLTATACTGLVILTCFMADIAPRPRSRSRVRMNRRRDETTLQIAA